MNRATTAAVSITFLVLVIGAWKVITDARFVNPMFLPAPEQTFLVLQDWFVSGTVWTPLGKTVWRMFAGWLLALLVGVALGAAIASSRMARDVFQPLAEFLRPLPASAVLPPAILLLGLSDKMIVTVIAFGAVWPVLLGAIHGFQSLDARLVEVSRLLRLSPWHRVFKLDLNNALPEIFAGARVALSLALILSVVAEMISSQEGIGHLVLVAARAFRSADIFAGVIVLGALGFLTNALMQRLEEHLLRWRPASTGA